MLYESSYWYYLRSTVLHGSYNEEIHLNLYFDDGFTQPASGYKFIMKSNDTSGSYLCIEPFMDFIILQYKNGSKFVLSKNQNYGFPCTLEFNKKFKILIN